MPPRDSADSNDPRAGWINAEASARRRTESPAELAAALEGLDRATRNFARLLGEAEAISAEMPSPRGPAPAAHGPCPAPAAAAERPPSGGGPGAADEAFAAHMREAEREARAYLEQAKRRADSLVRSMVAAVERESAEIRRGADAMVAERRDRIAALSDGISGRARALTAGMDDAERVRRQFDLFVRALAATADQIAADDAPPDASSQVRGLPRTRRPSAIAA